MNSRSTHTIYTSFSDCFVDDGSGDISPSVLGPMISQTIAKYKLLRVRISIRQTERAIERGDALPHLDEIDLVRALVHFRKIETTLLKACE